MIISITCVNSFLVYIQSVLNVKNKQKWMTPFIFLFTLFAEWGLFNFYILNFGVSYSSILVVFICLYSFTVCFFAFYYLKKWRIFLSCKFIFLRQIPVLLSLLFIAIFLIFYERGHNAVQSDLWFYYQLMNVLNSNHVNNFNNAASLLYANYLNVGIYQFGAALPLTSRLYIFPYLTTYFYFFAIFGATYEILEYFLKSDWKKIFIYLSLVAIFLFLYWYCNPPTYTVLVGNIESAFLLTIILLPSFLHFSQANTKIYILLLLFGFLFYNETSILVELFYFFAYFAFIFLMRNKYQLTLTYALLTLIVFIFPLYLWIYDYLTLSMPLFTEDIHHIFLALNLISYFETIIWILGVIFYYVDWNKFKNIKFNQWTNKINNYWLNNQLETNIAKKINANKNVKLTFKTLFALVINVFVIFSVFDLGFTQNVHLAQWAVSGVLYVFFTVIFTWIIFKNLYSPFCVYFFILLFIIFLIHCASLSQDNSTVWILQRITYIGIFPTYLQEGLIHDLVLLTYLVLLIKASTNWKWPFKKFKQNKHTRLFFKSFDVSLVSFACVCICVIVPGVQAGTWALNYVNVKSAQDVNLLGISKSSWNEIQKINFQDQLVFSDIYLPLANSTLSFNLTHLDYPAYGNLNEFYNYQLPYHCPFVNINGVKITDYDAQNFTNEILPYYNFVVVKTNDHFLIDILQKDNQTYKEWLNINNQVFIYKNNSVNKQLQSLFIKYNPLVQINKN